MTVTHAFSHKRNKTSAVLLLFLTLSKILLYNLFNHTIFCQNNAVKTGVNAKYV